ncbi:hypothetical protein EV360DRAFT_69102 [Lentinula raphanica]|nr:hypothetical protein EV360DRAFT_69102 [Lentinula raphanica]
MRQRPRLRLQLRLGSRVEGWVEIVVVDGGMTCLTEVEFEVTVEFKIGRTRFKNSPGGSFKTHMADSDTSRVTRAGTSTHMLAWAIENSMRNVCQRPTTWTGANFEGMFLLHPVYGSPLLHTLTTLQASVFQPLAGYPPTETMRTRVLVPLSHANTSSSQGSKIQGSIHPLILRVRGLEERCTIHAFELFFVFTEAPADNSEFASLSTEDDEREDNNSEDDDSEDDGNQQDAVDRGVNEDGERSGMCYKLSKIRYKYLKSVIMYSDCSCAIANNSSAIADDSCVIIETQILKPILVIEGKPLGKSDWRPNTTPWRSPEGRKNAADSLCLQTCLPQLRDQVDHTFPLLSPPAAALAEDSNTKCPVLVAQGIYLSLLLFDKEEEENVQNFIDEYLSSTKSKLEAEAAAGSAQFQKYQWSDIESLMKRQHEPGDPSIDIEKQMLPELIFHNEPLVLGNPAHSYNPVVMHAIKDILDQHNIILQPSWFTDGLENYEVQPSPEKESGLEDIYNAYTVPVNQDIMQHIFKLSMDKVSPSTDSGDSSYKSSDMNVDSPEIGTHAHSTYSLRIQRPSRLLTFDDQDDQEDDTLMKICNWKGKFLRSFNLGVKPFKQINPNCNFLRRALEAKFWMSIAAS